MSISTHSRFFFDYDVDSSNNALDFDEGGGELNATLNVGSYTFTEFAAEIKRAMDDVGGQAYTVTANRSTRTITISATSNFSLLITSGSNAGSSVFGDAGFTGADVSGTNSYEGNTTAGSEYTTQFILQNYIPSTNFQKAASGVVNKAASGAVEVVTFGTEKFIRMQFLFITDITQGGSVIRNRPSGVSDFRTFMQFMITKQPFEFMPDEDTVATFQKVILESTPEDGDGIGYRLQELFTRGLPGYYDSGNITLRVIE